MPRVRDAPGSRAATPRHGERTANSRVGRRRQGRGIDRRAGRHDDPGGQLRECVDAPLQNLHLRLVARAEADEDHRVTGVVDIDGIALLHQGGSIEDRTDERDVCRERHVGLELAWCRDEIERAPIVDVRDRVDRRESELGADRATAGSAGASISTSGPARNSENAAWNNATVGTLAASPAHSPPISIASTRSTSAGSRSSSSQHIAGDVRAEPELLRHERHLAGEVERPRRVVVGGVHERAEPPTVAAAAFVDRAVTEQPDVVPVPDEGLS